MRPVLGSETEAKLRIRARHGSYDRANEAAAFPDAVGGVGVSPEGVSLRSSANLTCFGSCAVSESETASQIALASYSLPCRRAGLDHPY